MPSWGSRTDDEQIADEGSSLFLHSSSSRSGSKLSLIPALVLLQTVAALAPNPQTASAKAHKSHVEHC